MKANLEALVSDVFEGLKATDGSESDGLTSTFLGAAESDARPGRGLPARGNLQLGGVSVWRDGRFDPPLLRISMPCEGARGGEVGATTKKQAEAF